MKISNENPRIRPVQFQAAFWMKFLGRILSAQTIFSITTGLTMVYHDLNATLQIICPTSSEIEVLSIVSRIFASRIQPTLISKKGWNKNDHKDEYNRPLKPAKSLKPLKNLQTPLSITFLLRNRRNFRVFEIMKVANFIQYEK